jgi:hypothetical protein
MIFSNDGLLDLKLKVPQQLAQRLITKASIGSSQFPTDNHYASDAEMGSTGTNACQSNDHNIHGSSFALSCSNKTEKQIEQAIIVDDNHRQHLDSKNLRMNEDKARHEYRIITNPVNHMEHHQNENDLFNFFLTYSSGYVLNLLCVLCLLLLIIDFSSSTILNGQAKQQCSGCMYLMISPITNSGLIFFNIYHKNSRRLSFGMAMTSLLLGNVAGIIYCSSSPLPILFQGMDLGLLCLSMSLIIGAFQLLMLMSKTNIAIVMISTASGVVICGLSIAALFLPNAASRRCYQSTIPCILWLLWQASQKRKI